MNQALIGQIAGLIAFIAFIPYFLSILRGETRPERATFAIWSFVNIVTLLSYFAAGARETIWILFVYTVLQIAVFILSLKYGMGGFNKFDIICLGGATLGMLLWIITKNPLTALYLAVFSEFLGWVPTVKKVYLFPETENTLSWSIGAVATLLNLFALTSLKPEISLYPIYLFLGEFIITFLLLFPKMRYQPIVIR